MDERTQIKIAKLARILKFPEHEQELLQLALTHRSVGDPNNERLEFLGDGVLNFIIASQLYTMMPQADEGTLTRLRANLVRKETLTELAEQLNLGEYLILGQGERKSGGHHRSSILADALEAIIGATFCSEGFALTRDKVLGYYQAKLAEISQEKLIKDPKTSLQELLQAKKLQLPLYEVIEITGEKHEQTFHVKCSTVILTEAVVGIGISRRKAEQDAAAKALILVETYAKNRQSR